MKSFRSNGKLLLTAEYAVLDGATALALPAKFGQILDIEKNSSNSIQWTSIDHQGLVWFEDTISIETIISNQKIEYKNDIAKRLVELLRVIHSKNPDILTQDSGFAMTTTLEFDRHWGLGTSSTLINNLANWAKVDAFYLLEKTFGGSGYDIACAQHNSPILFERNDKRQEVKPIDFEPSFKNNLYFVYLNQKQNSREGISRYKQIAKTNKTAIKHINALTHGIVQCHNLEEFNELIVEHEILISELIDQTPIKNLLFPDFDGEIKSLGAWGGDFILATSTSNPKAYFSSKGYDTILPYQELILE